MPFDDFTLNQTRGFALGNRAVVLRWNVNRVTSSFITMLFTRLRLGQAQLARISGPLLRGPRIVILAPALAGRPSTNWTHERCPHDSQPHGLNMQLGGQSPRRRPLLAVRRSNRRSLSAAAINFTPPWVPSPAIQVWHPAPRHQQMASPDSCLPLGMDG